MTEEEKAVLDHLLETITKAQLAPKQLIPIIANFLYSIGNSIEHTNGLSSKEVLERYSTKPTFGSALMAQAMLMLEAWNEDS